MLLIQSSRLIAVVRHDGANIQIIVLEKAVRGFGFRPISTQSQLSKMRKLIENYKRVRQIIEQLVETNIEVSKQEIRR